MSTANRPNRKASDQEIVRLNSIGLSLGTIAEKLDCHPTTITLRLQQLSIPPADTRRAFMEDIYNNLAPDMQKWLAEQLGPHISVKDFVRGLIIKEYMRRAA